MAAEMFVPRLKRCFARETVKEVIGTAVMELGYERPTNEQDAVSNFLLGRDVFVTVPTGGGKSLCYACLPSVYDHLRKDESLHHAIVVVVSPLSALMQDQVSKFTTKGVRAVYIGSEQDDPLARQKALKGEAQLVFMSPESLLSVLMWREMFRSRVYQENIVCLAVDEAHLVEKW